MSQEIQKKDNTVAAKLSMPAFRGRIDDLLKDRAPQFCSSLIQVASDPKLSSCDPVSIITAGLSAASLDLPINPNLGFAYIVPYNGIATFQIGYKGFVQLAYRTGQYKRLNVTEVYDGELLKYDRVKSDVLIDESKRKPGAKVIGYVAYFELLNGAEHALFWTIEATRAHAQRHSQAFRSGRKDTPWQTDFDAMGKKTVLKSLLSHWGPMSIQMNDALLVDQSARNNPDSLLEYPDNAPAIEERPPRMEEPEAPAPQKRSPRSMKSQPAPGLQPPPADWEGTEAVMPGNKESSAAVGTDGHASPIAPAQPKPEVTARERLEKKMFVDAKVPFGDFCDFLEINGYLKNARLLKNNDEVPPVVWDMLSAESDRLANKCIQIYGERNQ